MDLLAARPQGNSMTSTLLSPYFARLEACSGLRWQGRVTQVIGQLVESKALSARWGTVRGRRRRGRFFPGR